MIFDQPCWIWSGVLPQRLCDTLIDEGDMLITGDGRIGGGDNHQGAYDPKIRETNISFFEPGHWVEGLAMHYAQWANAQAKWNILISYPQPLQYARYFPDQLYKPHRDDTISHNKQEMRKLSVVFQISDPNTYQGGDFVIEDGHEDGQYKIINEFKPRGSVIVFPSLLKHGVTPVTKGVRHSMVCWVVGPNFR